MYRRKRKRLISQQEINPGAVIDEPGWVYFTRLKFLDDDSQIHTDFGPFVFLNFIVKFLQLQFHTI